MDSATDFSTPAWVRNAAEEASCHAQDKDRCPSQKDREGYDAQ